MSLGYIFIGKDLDNRKFVFNEPKDLEIGSAIASHVFISKRANSCCHLTNTTDYTCITLEDDMYYIINYKFPKLEQPPSIMDYLPFVSHDNQSVSLSDFYLEQDVEVALKGLINVYRYTGVPNSLLCNDDLINVFIDSQLKLTRNIHDKLVKLQSDVYWTPRFSKCNTTSLPLMRIDQSTATNNISSDLVKYLILQIMNTDISEFPSYLKAFKRPAQCRVNFISDLHVDNNYYIFQDLVNPDKKTCIWIPIPFIIIVFTVAGRENLSEIFQEIESDLGLMQRLCDCHNSILTSMLPKTKEIKKRVQYCFYPNTASYIFGKYQTYYIKPDVFTQIPCKINLNVAHGVSALIRRYLLSFERSKEAIVVAKPKASRLLNERKIGSNSMNLMNFWIIHKDQVLAIAFGATNSIIRSCPSGVNLDNIKSSEINLTLEDAREFLKSFEDSFVQ